MKRFSWLASAFALGMGMAILLRTDHQDHFPSPNEIVARSTDGAFRDGLYLGRLAAQCSAEPHVASGRWATLEDRSSFTAGYQRGYSELFPNRAGPIAPGHGAELKLARQRSRKD
jgi:hypothetical protein